jgi:formamidopyrimidine-DNA glycosylase
MPELPEVETIRAGLAPALEGLRIGAVALNRPDLRFPFPERFAARLRGAKVLRLHRRGKYLLADLDTGEVWLSHLGMTGRFSVIAAEEAARPGDFYYAAPPDPKHTHVVLEIEGGGCLEYNDPRRFGYMDLLPGEGWEQSAHFAGMGPEPLSNGFSGPVLAAALDGRVQPIKTLLLDQRIVAGLGNIYVCEALFLAGIHPTRAGGKISARRLEALAGHVREVLTAAIAAGGSSLRDYAQADGALGYFQHTFRVYDREGETCVRPGCAGSVRRLVQGGRSTFYCATCQT